ncbi:MAG: hypothetical protein AAF074_24435 [Pseudomonadota bacterium]
MDKSIAPIPALKTGPIRRVSMNAGRTVRLSGYKSSIINFLLEDRCRDAIFASSTPQGFETATLQLRTGSFLQGPTTPSEMMAEQIKKLALSLSPQALRQVKSGIQNTLFVGRVAASFMPKVHTVADLKEKHSYRNAVTREIHHVLHKRVFVDLQIYASPKHGKFATRWTDLGVTEVSFPALALLVEWQAP